MDKPELELSEQDGNAFSILGRAARVAKKAGWNAEEFKKFREEAMSGNYDHLLATCDKYFDVS